MIPIVGTLLSEGLTWLAKGLFSSAKDKVTKFVKEKTGIDLNTGQLKPEDIAKLRELEMSNQQELRKMYFEAVKAELQHEELLYQEDTKRMGFVNKTYQTELISNDPYVRRARPTLIYIAGISFGILIFAIVFAIILGPFTGHAKEVKEILSSAKDILTNDSIWYFLLATVGITAYGRTREKVNMMKVMNGITQEDNLLQKLGKTFTKNNG